MSINWNVNDVIEAKLEYYNGESRCFNILHWRMTNIVVTATGLPPAVEIPFATIGADLAGDIYSFISNEWKNLASSFWSMTSCTVQNVHPLPRSLPLTYIPGAAVTGMIADDSLPAQDTATILKKTDFGERWGMGRIYVPGLPENAQNNGVLNAGAVTALQDLADTFQAFAGGTAGAYSYALEPVLFGAGDGGPRINPIRAHTLSDNVLKTQRRRRPGKGI